MANKCSHMEQIGCLFFPWKALAYPGHQLGREAQNLAVPQAASPNRFTFGARYLGLIFICL